MCKYFLGCWMLLISKDVFEWTFFCKKRPWYSRDRTSQGFDNQPYPDPPLGWSHKQLWEQQTIPCARSSGLKLAILLYAPRSLNEKTGWRSSLLAKASYLRSKKSRRISNDSTLTPQSDYLCLPLSLTKPSLLDDEIYWEDHPFIQSLLKPFFNLQDQEFFVASRCYRMWSMLICFTADLCRDRSGSEFS